MVNACEKRPRAVFIDHKNTGIGKNMGVLGAVIVTAGVEEHISSCWRAQKSIDSPVSTGEKLWWRAM